MNDDQLGRSRSNSRYKRCVIKGCCSKSTRHEDKDISFFRFPNHESQKLRCVKWVICSGRIDLCKEPLENLRNKYFVCARHFKERQFSALGKNLLRRSAVPTLLCPPILVELSLERMQQQIDSFSQPELDISTKGFSSLAATSIPLQASSTKTFSSAAHVQSCVSASSNLPTLPFCCTTCTVAYSAEIHSLPSFSYINPVRTAITSLTAECIDMLPADTCYQILYQMSCMDNSKPLTGTVLSTSNPAIVQCSKVSASVASSVITTVVSSMPELTFPSEREMSDSSNMPISVFSETSTSFIESSVDSGKLTNALAVDTVSTTGVYSTSELNITSEQAIHDAVNMPFSLVSEISKTLTESSNNASDLTCLTKSKEQSHNLPECSFSQESSEKLDLGTKGDNSSLFVPMKPSAFADSVSLSNLSTSVTKNKSIVTTSSAIGRNNNITFSATGTVLGNVMTEATPSAPACNAFTNFYLNHNQWTPGLLVAVPSLATPNIFGSSINANLLNNSMIPAVPNFTRLVGSVLDAKSNLNRGNVGSSLLQCSDIVVSGLSSGMTVSENNQQHILPCVEPVSNCTSLHPILSHLMLSCNSSPVQPAIAHPSLVLNGHSEQSIVQSCVPKSNEPDVQNKSSCSKHTKSLNALSASRDRTDTRYIDLKMKIRRLLSQRWKLKRAVERLRHRLEEGYLTTKQRHRRREFLIEQAEAYLTPLQLSLFRAMVYQDKSNYHWSDKDKMFAIKLRRKSGVAYKFLESHLNLPARSTLNRFVKASIDHYESAPHDQEQCYHDQSDDSYLVEHTYSASKGTRATTARKHKRIGKINHVVKCCATTLPLTDEEYFAEKSKHTEKEWYNYLSMMISRLFRRRKALNKHLHFTSDDDGSLFVDEVLSLRSLRRYRDIDIVGLAQMNKRYHLVTDANTGRLKMWVTSNKKSMHGTFEPLDRIEQTVEEFHPPEDPSIVSSNEFCLLECTTQDDEANQAAQEILYYICE